MARVRLSAIEKVAALQGRITDIQKRLDAAKTEAAAKARREVAHTRLAIGALMLTALRTGQVDAVERQRLEEILRPLATLRSDHAALDRAFKWRATDDAERQAGASPVQDPAFEQVSKVSGVVPEQSRGDGEERGPEPTALHTVKDGNWQPEGTTSETLFGPARGQQPSSFNRPPTTKQVDYAKKLSSRLGLPLSEEACRSQASISKWIDSAKVTERQGGQAGDSLSTQGQE